jgi:hypothetical protein
MSATRWFVLGGGPPLLVVMAYAVCFSARLHDWGRRDGGVAPASPALQQASSRDSRELERNCQLLAAQLQDQLPEAVHFTVHSPFVLLGDFPAHELDDLYQGFVRDTARALWRQFFDRQPDEPVAIIVLRNPDCYAAIAARLDGCDPTAYPGYTQRHHRRIVCNLQTGRGTLSHELTHILALFDFPTMPEWFDEGLASLYENASFSDDGLILVGERNWRSEIVTEAWERNQLPAIETLVRSADFRGDDEGLNYAVARSLCLFLQERGVLSHYYRKLRSSCQEDPRGEKTLCAVLDARTLAEVDRQFREWLETNLRAAR